MIDGYCDASLAVVTFGRTFSIGARRWRFARTSTIADWISAFSALASMVRPVSDFLTDTFVVLMSTVASLAGLLTLTRTRSMSRWTAGLEYSIWGWTCLSIDPPVTSRHARLKKLPSRLASTAALT